MNYYRRRIVGLCQNLNTDMLNMRFKTMTRDDFIKLLKENLKPDAEMDFLVSDYKKPMIAFLDIYNVCMNVDVDDPDNKNRGGIVFIIKEDLT